MAEERFPEESPGAMFRELVAFREWRARTLSSQSGTLNLRLAGGRILLTCTAMMVNQSSTRLPLAISSRLPQQAFRTMNTRVAILATADCVSCLPRATLGVHIHRAAEDLASGINDAEEAMNSRHTTTLNSHARSSIKGDYETKIGELRENV